MSSKNLNILLKNKINLLEEKNVLDINTDFFPQNHLFLPHWQIFFVCVEVYT